MAARFHHLAGADFLLLGDCPFRQCLLADDPAATREPSRDSAIPLARLSIRNVLLPAMTTASRQTDFLFCTAVNGFRLLLDRRHNPAYASSMHTIRNSDTRRSDPRLRSTEAHPASRRTGFAFSYATHFEFVFQSAVSERVLESGGEDMGGTVDSVSVESRMNVIEHDSASDRVVPVQAR